MHLKIKGILHLTETQKLCNFYRTYTMICPVSWREEVEPLCSGGRIDERTL